MDSEKNQTSLHAVVVVVVHAGYIVVSFWHMILFTVANLPVSSMAHVVGTVVAYLLSYLPRLIAHIQHTKRLFWPDTVRELFVGYAYNAFSTRSALSMYRFSPCSAMRSFCAFLPSLRSMDTLFATADGWTFGSRMADIRSVIDGRATIDEDKKESMQMR